MDRRSALESLWSMRRSLPPGGGHRAEAGAHDLSAAAFPPNSGPLPKRGGYVSRGKKGLKRLKIIENH